MRYEIVTDHDNLIRAHYRARNRGGWAPGLDGLTFSDLGRSEVADIYRRISTFLRTGQYQPGPLRHAQIPKADGSFRTLSILPVPDRVVATALRDALAPTIDRSLSPYTFGFRRGLGTHALLASLHREIIEHGHYVIAQDDVRDAFGSVRVADAMSDLATIIQDPRTLRLVEALVRVREGQEVGIAQGSPLSPLLLNHHVNTRLDAHRGDPGTPVLHIYADNLVVACSTAPVGQTLIDETGQRLSEVGMTLKQESETVDIRLHGAWADILGIRVSFRRGELRYGATDEAIAALRRNLMQCHENAHASAQARAAIAGWLHYISPVYSDARATDSILRRVLRLSSELGFAEVLSANELSSIILRGRDRWESLVHGRTTPVGESPMGEAEDEQLVESIRDLRAPRVSTHCVDRDARPAASQVSPGRSVAPF